jgi:hypothetical protein
VPKAPRNRFSAAEHALGYVYQARFALLKAMSMPETTSIFLEKEDDVDFVAQDGRRLLSSLKHKKEGDRVTDLSVDFWKSVRIWATHDLSSGRLSCESRFLLFTTAFVAPGSALEMFVEDVVDGDEAKRMAQGLITQSQSSLIAEVRDLLAQLTEAELGDFYSRITIVDETNRITEIPALMDQYLRTIRRPNRTAVFERLEGWFTDLVIKMLAGERTAPVVVQEISDKLAILAEEYHSDNLPITFRDSKPISIDAANDSRLFVEQLS